MGSTEKVYKTMLLFLFLALVSTVSGQTFILSNSRAFGPRIGDCTNPDIYDGPFINSTECGDRSDGCNYDTGYCILAQILGYPIQSNFMSILPVFIASAAMPGESDGLVNISISYTNLTFFSPEGILQIWQLDRIENSIEVYAFANREVYIRPTPPNTVQTFTFLDLPAGQYIAAFWDWGGTRYGNGIPEVSAQFTIQNVFPVHLDFSLTFVEQYSVSNATSSFVYPETLIDIAHKHYLGYRLTAQGVSEDTLVGYLNNANSVHNRPPAWIWRTDKGNYMVVVTNKDQVCFPTIEYRSAAPCTFSPNLCGTLSSNTIGTTCTSDRWTRVTIMPMNTGGYGSVRASGEVGAGTSFDIYRRGRKSMLEFRLNYGGGILGAVAYDYWAHRQQYFRTTVLAQKRLAAIQVDNTERQSINGQNSGPEIASYNHMRHVNSREDLLVVYYVRYSTEFSSAPRFNYGMYMGLLQTGMESYGAYDMNGNFDDYWGATMFPQLPFYRDHYNNETHGDWSCWPVGSDYIININALLSVCAACDTEFTFADLSYDAINVIEYNGECTDVSAFTTNPLIPPYYIPCQGTTPSECSLCCAMNSSPTLRTYPCYMPGTYYLGALAVPLNSQSYFGVSPHCTPRIVVGSQIMARYYQENGNRAGGLPLSPLIGTYTSLQGDAVTDNSWSVYDTLKDCTAGPIFTDYKWFTNRFLGAQTSRQIVTPYYQRTNIYFGVDNMVSQSPFITPAFIVPTTASPGPLPTQPEIIDDNGDVIGTAWRISNTLSSKKAGVSSWNTKFGTTGPFLGYPAPSGTVYPYVSQFSSYLGPDTITATLQFYQQAVKTSSSQLIYPSINNQITFAYARFLQYPRVNFHNFMNAIFPHDLEPATIDVEFRVSCPNLEMGYGPKVAYCAQGWRITNQVGANIIVSVPKGSLETDPLVIAATGWPAGQVLGGVKTDAVFTVRVLYNNGDLLHWEFVLAPEPEYPYGSSQSCRYSTTDSAATTPLYKYQFVPEPIEVLVPPQEYVFLPMIINVASAPPACPYDPQEVRARAFRQQYYNFAVINDQALQTVTDTGQRSETQLYYYYDWRVGADQTRIQGFSESTQLYTPPMTLTVFDNFFASTTTTINLIPVDPLYPNPLLRPPRCVSETLANASCPVNLQDNPAYSGINQYQYCSNTGVNSVSLTARFVFIFPYSYNLNVGSCFFNRTTAYIDPFIEDQIYGGIFEDCRTLPFVVDQNSDPSGSVWVSLKVRYGITIASFFNVPCWERLITHVFILSSFVLTPLPIERIPLCSRLDNCCYRQPFAVSGTSPYTGLPINMDNVTDPCFGTDACAYEIVVSPPANNIGGLCLGVTYTFTAQSPAALVANRTGPFGSGFPNAWRCPDTVQITLPFGGFSPVDVATFPGPCTSPGTSVHFTFQYTDVYCEGPISAANEEPLCQRDLYFALQSVNNSNTAYFLAGAPSLLIPYLLTGIRTLTYNLQGAFNFPEFFSIPGFPPVPNGYWNAYFWTQPSGSTPNYAGVSNPSDTVNTNFVASLSGIDGIVINRLEYIRPPCPGPPMLLNFLIYDLAFNGPYNITFYTPNYEVVDSIIIGFEYCVGFGLVPTAQLLADCAIQIQSQGIPITARIPTGNISNGETGMYTLYVFAALSECPAVYQEFIQSLETLRVQIECVNTTCPGGRDGNVNTEVTGGTRIPVINITTYQGSNFDIWRPLYYYVWSTPQGLFRTTDLLRVPAGFYQLNVTDYNGCKYPPVSCTVGSLSTQMNLVPVSQIPPNCTGQLGQVNFTVAGGIPPYSLYKISNRSVVVTESYTILADSTVVPGVNSSYVIIDSLGCVSPQVSFYLEGAPPFYLNLVVVAYPCDVNSATGTIRADTPGGLGTVLVWTNLLTGQVVSSSTNCLLGSQCLTVTNLPASTYRVTATSTIYGCTATADIALTARPPPDIQITRQQDANSAFLDVCQGSFFSTNGPPYTVSFFGIDFNVPLPQRPVFNQQPPSGNLAFWTLTNLPAQTTFQLTVVDAGQCQSTITSLGRQITIVDNIVTPTPIPGQYSGQPTPLPANAEHYNPNGDMLFILFIFIVPFSVVVIGIIGYMVFRGQRRSVGETRRK